MDDPRIREARILQYKPRQFGKLRNLLCIGIREFFGTHIFRRE